MDLFYSPSNLLGKRALKKFDDPKAWQNIFYKEVTSRIDEDTFSVLFNDSNGAPNSSVCILVAMMLLKEEYGCSDEQLFEKCELDLLARKALGLDGFEEDIPCAATYYNLRAALVKHNAEKGEDLLQKCFEQVTGDQVKAYGVSGRSVRMDSKLIGSNIASYSRYVLVHKTMCKYLKYADLSVFDDTLRTRLEEYLKEDPNKTGSHPSDWFNKSRSCPFNNRSKIRR
ncbi:MAG: transposase [Muribaculum sp.]|nr:transposase [Muribaculum sp.]